MLADERARWPLWLPVAFALGVGTYFALGFEPAPWSGALGLLGSLVALWCLRKRGAVLLLCFALASATAGFTAAQLRSALVSAPILEKSLKGRSVEGEVVQLEPRAKGRRVVLRSLVISGLAPEETPARVRISLAGEHGADLRPGDRIALRAELRPPPGPVAPDAFDFGRRAYFQSLGGFGFAFGGPKLLARGGQNDWTLWLADLRQAIAERIRARLPGESGAVAVALMIGQRGGISEAVLEDMRGAGLAHLLAISGLHMGLIAGWLFLFLRGLLALVPRFALYYPIKKWAAAVAVIGAFAYLGIAGAPIPTIRAFIMVATVLAAVMLDRRALSLRLVAWAAAIILAVLPESLVSVSFQLSFAAVVALIATYESLALRGRSWTAERNWPTRTAVYVGSVALTSLIASLATAPFAAYHFNRIALYGILANLLAVPLTAFWIMPWALIAFLLMPFGLEGLALAPMGWGIDLLLFIAAKVAAWPGAFLPVKAMPLAALLAFALGGLWLCIWQRPWRYGGIAAFAVAVLLAGLAKPPDLWVSDDGRLFGIRGDDARLYLSSRRIGRFEAEIWQRRAGLSAQASFPKEGAVLEGALRCDPLGCLYGKAGQRVAFLVDPRGLWEDCAEATVLISSEPVRRASCPEPAVLIDRFDLWRNGAYSLRLEAGEVAVKSVREERGERPWVPRHGDD